MVALTWALETAILPAMNVTNGRIAAIGSVFYFMLIKTFIDTVLYDIRDVKGDAESGVKTIPVIIGPQKDNGHSAAAREHTADYSAIHRGYDSPSSHDPGSIWIRLHHILLRATQSSGT